MYCNSCMTQIGKSDEVVNCSQCNVPLHSGCANHCLSCDTVLCDVCYSKNNFYCESCKPPSIMFATIRRSHIEQYQSCPYSLYLMLIKQVPVPDGEHAKLGTIVHQIIDKIRNNLVDATQSMDEFESEFRKGFHDSEDADLTARLYERGLTSLRFFWSIKDLFTSEKFESELNIIYSLDDGLPSISCTLDEIDWIGEDIHVSDWKTGKSMSGQKLITDLQAPLYIEGVHQKYGVYPKTFTFYYLEEGKVKTYNRNEDGTYTVKSGKTDYVLNVNDALERTKDILQKINAGNFNMPTGTHEWYCKNMCYFYKSGICDSTMSEQWKILNNKYDSKE